MPEIDIELVRKWDEEQRIEFLKRKWVFDYPAMAAITAELKKIVKAENGELENLALFAKSRNGKSTIAEDLVAQFPMDMNPNGDAAVLPIVHVELPNISTIGGFAKEVLKKCFEVRNPRTPASDLLASAETCLETMGVKLLIIDEFQHLEVGDEDDIVGLMNTIKAIGNRCNVSVCLMGGPKGLNILGGDPQLSGRFEHRFLPLWNYDQVGCSMLASIESKLPLRRVSNLGTDPKLAERIIGEAGGILGFIQRLIKAAAVRAIESGKEKIDMTILESLDWRNEAERYEHARQMIGATEEELDSL